MDLQTIIICVIIGACICVLGYKAFIMCKENQKENLKQWLIYACTEAEKILGSKTGKIKLRYVYNMFIERYKFLGHIITFEQFSLIVDNALIEMRIIIDTNQAVKNLVEGDK